MRKKLYMVRLGLLVLALSLGCVGLLKHLYGLQVGRREELFGKAKRKYTSSRTQEGRRGRIFDMGGYLLAGNLACRDVLAEPRRFRDARAGVIATLSRELGIPPGDLARKFARVDKAGSNVVEVVVARRVDIRTAERLSGYQFPGLRFVDSSRRFYPKDSLLANVLGFTDHTGVGASGVEALMETNLRPTQGKTVYERDRRGHRLADGIRAHQAVRDGHDVYLTILEPVQQIVEDELAVMADTFLPRAAYAVMADPGTGNILAMAQYPNFNANDRSTMTDPDCWRNRILTDGFEPGSVMKGISIAGALDYAAVTLNSVFDCEHGYWTYCRRPLRDSGHQYDELAVWEIIQKSSNIGTAKIALEMGEGCLYQTLRRFGFGQPTGVGFSDEASGIFRPLDRWDGLSVTRFPIGQGILVTPLQLVQAYSALANDGVMMQLHLVDRIVDPVHGDVYPFKPFVKRRAVRPAAARQMTQALKLVTTPDGTARKAAVTGYEVAGKTGTAQKWISGSGGARGHYSHSKFIAGFIGYVPADDPAIVLLVVADEPGRGSHYGGTVAGPTFSRIAEKTLRYLQVGPTAREPIELTLNPGREPADATQTTHRLH